MKKRKSEAELIKAANEHIRKEILKMEKSKRHAVKKSKRSLRITVRDTDRTKPSLIHAAKLLDSLR